MPRSTPPRVDIPSTIPTFGELALKGTDAYLKAIRTRALDPADVTSWLKRRARSGNGILGVLDHEIGGPMHRERISPRRGRGDVRLP